MESTTDAVLGHKRSSSSPEQGDHGLKHVSQRRSLSESDSPQSPSLFDRPQSPGFDDFQNNFTQLSVWLNMVRANNHLPLIIFNSSNPVLLNGVIEYVAQGRPFDLFFLPNIKSNSSAIEAISNVRQYACVITDDSFASTELFIRSPYIRRIVTTTDFLQNRTERPARLDMDFSIDAKEPSTRFLSSGSTGKPKIIDILGHPHIAHDGPWSAWFSEFVSTFKSINKTQHVFSCFVPGFDAFTWTMLMSKDGKFSPSDQDSDENLANAMIASFQKGEMPVLCCLPSRLNSLLKTINTFDQPTQDLFEQK